MKSKSLTTATCYNTEVMKSNKYLHQTQAQPIVYGNELQCLPQVK